MSILLGILTFILILVSIFLILVVLAQKTKDGGVGSALGGGATEAAFGAETGNVLTKMTKYSAILFFVLAFALYLGRLYERKHGGASGGSMPTIAVPATPPAPTAAAPMPGSPAVETPAASGAAVTVPGAAPATTPAPTTPVTPAPTGTKAP